MTNLPRLPLLVAVAALGATNMAAAKPIKAPQPSVTTSGYVAFPGPAGSVTCPQPVGDYNRLFTLGAATACFWDDDNNPNETNVNTLEPTWDDWDEIERDTSTPDGTFLTTSATFGALPTDKEWFLDSSYWFEYGQAVIGIKVGGGQGSPDWMGFLIDPGATNGTFSVSQLTGATGGGLSNMILFGRGSAYCASPTQPGCEPDEQVPEPGTLALLALGLLGIGLRRRRN